MPRQSAPHVLDMGHRLDLRLLNPGEAHPSREPHYSAVADRKDRWRTWRGRAQLGEGGLCAVAVALGTFWVAGG